MRILPELVAPVVPHSQTSGLDDGVVVDAPHLAPESASAVAVARPEAQLGGDALAWVGIAGAVKDLPARSNAAIKLDIQRNVPYNLLDLGQQFLTGNLINGITLL